MKSKGYIEQHLDALNSSVSSLTQDIDNERYYVNKQYLLERLEYLKKLVILVQDRVALEDENP